MTLSRVNFPPQVLRDRDVFESFENHIFVTHGFIQPHQRTICYLKYVPNPEGRWKSPFGRYHRVFSGGPESVSSGMNVINKSYLVYDRHFGVRLLEVPNEKIRRYYKPEERLKEIVKDGPRDPLETRAKELAEALHDTLDISFEKIGVTGSISWHGHDPSFSDVNMNVYGLEAIDKLRNGRDDLVEQNHRIRYRRLDEWVEGTIARLCDRISTITSSDLIPLFKRRREICLDDVYIGIMPVLLPDETPIKYGSESYQTVYDSLVSVRLEIKDTYYGSFTPAIYETSSAPLSIIDNAGITRLMIYDSAFKDLLMHGDIVDASGTLQKVTSKDSEEYYQLMIGTLKGAGNEFIRLVN